MRKKMIQLAIVLIASVLLCVSATTGRGVLSPQAQQKNAHKKGADKPQHAAPTPEEEALAQVEPEAYRGIQGLNVPAGSRVSILMREGDSDFAKGFEEGSKQAGADLNKALGYKGKDKVKVVCNAPSKPNDSASQGNILDEELNLYPDVVAASLVDAAACEVQFDLAMENGIYIVGFDASPGYDRVVATVETDNAQAAEEAADHLKDALLSANAQGPVLVFSNDQTSTSLKIREDTVISRISRQSPTFNIAAVCHLSDLDAIKQEMAQRSLPEAEEPAAAETDTEKEEARKEEMAKAIADIKQEDVIRYLFEKHTDVAGVFMADEASADAVLPIMEELQINAGAVAFGGEETLGEHVQEGRLVGFVQENPYGMGYATAVAAFRVITGQGNATDVVTGHRWMPQTE